jgi:hypothetical protein
VPPIEAEPRAARAQILSGQDLIRLGPQGERRGWALVILVAIRRDDQSVAGMSPPGKHE